MADLTPERGAYPVLLDRNRIVFFDHRASWQVYQRYGAQFVSALYSIRKDGGKSRVEVKDPDAMAYFLWAGLQADARAHGEELTLEQVEAMLRPATYHRAFNALVLALTFSLQTPEPPGKGAAAETPAAAAPASPAPADPGPTRVTTSSKRSGLRLAASGGPSKRSGRQR